MAGGTSPWRDTGVAERGGDPGSRRMTTITGSCGVGPAFMTCRNSTGYHGVVTGGARRGRHDRMVHGGRSPAGGAVTAVAGGGAIGAALMVGRNTSRIDAVTGGAGPRRDTGVTERGGDPGSCRVTGVTGPGCHATFVPAGNAARNGGVVTGGARRGGDDGVVHGRGLPGRGAMTAVAGGGAIGAALMVIRKACGIDAVTGRTGAGGNTCVVHRRRPPRIGLMAAIAGCCRVRPTFVPHGDARRRFSVAGCTGTWCHAGMIECCRAPGRSSVAIVTGSWSQTTLVTGGYTGCVNPVTGRTGAGQHTGVIITTSDERPRATALPVTGIARRSSTHMAGRLTHGNRSIVTLRTGSRQNAIVRKERRLPVRGAMATVTVYGRRKVVCRFECGHDSPSGRVTLHALSRSASKYPLKMASLALDLSMAAGE